MFNARQEKEQTIEPRRWNRRENGFARGEFFAEGDGQFRGYGPLIPVLRTGDRKPGLAQEREKSGAAVARAMVIHDVVIGPQHPKSGHSEKQNSARFQQSVSAGEGASRIFQMLENIQHEQQVVTLAGLETAIEWSDVNFGGIRAGGIDEMGVGLDAFDVAKLGQAGEKQSVTTTNV